MFKQLDIDYNKVTIDGVEFLKPSGASSTDWLNAWESARFSFEDPCYLEDAIEARLAIERKEYEETIAELEKERDDLQDEVSELEKERDSIESELEALMEETE